jgi:hypothetical protein
MRAAWTQRGRGEPCGRTGALLSTRPSYCAPIAQLDRASDYESEGRVFESPWAHSAKPS